MLNKEIFIKREVDPPHYCEWTKIASFTLFTQISQLHFVMRLGVSGWRLLSFSPSLYPAPQTPGCVGQIHGCRQKLHLQNVSRLKHIHIHWPPTHSWPVSPPCCSLHLGPPLYEPSEVFFLVLHYRFSLSLLPDCPAKVLQIWFVNKMRAFTSNCRPVLCDLVKSYAGWYDYFVFCFIKEGFYHLAFTGTGFTDVDVGMRDGRRHTSHT